MTDATEVDLFKFFIDKAYVENGLLYTRSAVFTSLLVLIAGFAIKELALAEKRSRRTRSALILVALLGLGMSVAWFFVCQRSVESMQAWHRDAHRIATNSEAIRKCWSIRPWGSPQAGGETDTPALAALAFWKWRPSTWYKALAVMFGTFWLVLLVMGLRLPVTEGQPQPPREEKGP